MKNRWISERYVAEPVDYKAFRKVEEDDKFRRKAILDAYRTYIKIESKHGVKFDEKQKKKELKSTFMDVKNRLLLLPEQRDNPENTNDPRASCYIFEPNILMLDGDMEKLQEAVTSGKVFGKPLKFHKSKREGEEVYEFYGGGFRDPYMRKENGRTQVFISTGGFAQNKFRDIKTEGVAKGILPEEFNRFKQPALFSMISTEYSDKTAFTKMMDYLAKNGYTFILQDANRKGVPIAYHLGQARKPEEGKGNTLENKVILFGGVLGFIASLFFLFSSSNKIQLSPGVGGRLNWNLWIGITLLVAGLCCMGYWILRKKSH